MIARTRQSRYRMLLLLPPLALGVPAPAMAEDAMHITVCGSAGTVQIPLPANSPLRQKDSCPGACHAITCERQKGDRKGNKPCCDT